MTSKVGLSVRENEGLLVGFAIGMLLDIFSLGYKVDLREGGDVGENDGSNIDNGEDVGESAVKFPSVSFLFVEVGDFENNVEFEEVGDTITAIMVVGFRVDGNGDGYRDGSKVGDCEEVGALVVTSLI